MSLNRAIQFSTTIKSFADNGFPMSAANLGKEKSESSPRVLYIGGKQQRLYQAKSYRLGFARSNYVWNPVSKTFVDTLGQVIGNTLDVKPVIRVPQGTKMTVVVNADMAVPPLKIKR